jgi:hypothetical protein
VRTSRERRYGWFRVYEGVGSHPVWARAATAAGCSTAEALAVGLWLMTVASKGRPRGSLEDFDAVSCAAVLRIPAERVEALYAALEGGRKPWIERGQIVDWDERQPLREDGSATERQRKARARKKETWSALGHAASRNVTPMSRSVTPDVTHGHAPVTHQGGTSHANVTEMERDVTQGHAGVTPQSVTITDRDLDLDKITSSSTLNPARGSEGTGEGNPVKPPHAVTRAELDAVVERKRLEREEMLRQKREAIRAGYGSAADRSVK